MRIALSAASLPDADLPDLLAAATEAGYDAVSLFRHRTEASIAHADWSARRIREALSQAGVQALACEIRPLTGRKADSDERNLAYNLRQLEWDTHLCRALGITTVGLRAGAATDEAADDLLDGLRQLAERIPDVRFAIGPQPDSCLSSAAQIDALLPQLPDSVGVLLDTAQLAAAGDDLAACASRWSSRLQLVYLHDTQTGGIDVVDTIRSADFSGPVAIETTDGSLVQARERLGR